MSFRRLLFVLIALCVSGGTVLLGRAWLTPKEPVQAPVVVDQGPHVLVAQANLSAGQFVRPENLRWQAWPADGVAASYIVEGKGRIEDYVGAVVRSAVAEGEPVTDTRLVRPGDRGFMAAVLTPGYRAVTVTVTVSSGLAGFVFPGDRIDLLLTMAVPEPNSKMQRHAAETLLTDLRVLAVDQRSDDQNKDVVVEKTATLEVTPKQAETIAVAIELGSLSLSLRSLAHGDTPDSVQYSHTWDSDATHLIDMPEQKEPAPATAAAPAPPVVTNFKVTVIHGEQVKELQFARGGK
ncbi:MAG TPA: Flp pilus assembly protein CpaB [Stellaceae bacterium]|nr:Flp pilus assembly protein CpaB [Stellaceae bacterium]